MDKPMTIMSGLWVKENKQTNPPSSYFLGNECSCEVEMKPLHLVQDIAVNHYLKSIGVI